MRYIFPLWVSYLSFSFIFLQTDPRLWEMNIRITYVVINVITPIIMYFIMKDDTSKYNRYDFD